jgi:hypothetical protein
MTPDITATRGEARERTATRGTPAMTDITMKSETTEAAETTAAEEKRSRSATSMAKIKVIGQ